MTAYVEESEVIPECRNAVTAEICEGSPASAEGQHDGFTAALDDIALAEREIIRDKLNLRNTPGVRNRAAL